MDPAWSKLVPKSVQNRNRKLIKILVSKKTLPTQKVREGPAKIGQGPAAEARPPGRGYPGLGWGPGALGTSNLAKVILTRPHRRGSGRIEDACGESPAASLLWLRSLGEVQIIRSLFVHHSFIIRSHACTMQTEPSKRHVTVPRGDFWVSWERLGES